MKPRWAKFLGEISTLLELNREADESNSLENKHLIVKPIFIEISTLLELNHDGMSQIPEISFSFSFLLELNRDADESNSLHFLVEFNRDADESNSLEK